MGLETTLKKKQEEVNQLFKEKGLTDEVLEQQIEINIARHENNIPDETEIIYEKYVQWDDPLKNKEQLLLLKRSKLKFMESKLQLQQKQKASNKEIHQTMVDIHHVKKEIQNLK